MAVVSTSGRGRLFSYAFAESWRTLSYRLHASPLYHFHPHVDEEHVHPNGIGEQVDRAMTAAKEVLDNVGATWTDVVKITKYLTDIRDMDGMSKAMAPYFGDWKPASTTICINQLSSPGARVELDMIVAIPKK